MIRARLLIAAMMGLATVMTRPPQARAAEDAGDADIAWFETHVRPVLAQYCYECHSTEAKKLKANLRLDSRQGWMTGGDSGPALVPGDPAGSLLIRAISYKDIDLQMPPKNRLPAEAVATLTEWIQRGAPDPRSEAPGSRPRPAAPGIDLEAGRKHWAYQPIQQVAPPAVKQAAWPINDVDRHILAALEAKGLAPGADADKVTLVRRLYFVLTGLPPTPRQIDAYVNDTRPDAYERLVDELLTSPQYGERWGRHWLDVARYAESLTLRGFILTDAWRYRDYVINSFNEDRPFNEFMQEQVAGDLMTSSSADEAQRRQGIVATAFLALGNHNLEEQDKKLLEMDIVDEQLEAVGRAFLAQTIGCARCHDHKFDPIPTRDYYALAGILKSTQSVTHANVSNWIQADLPMPPEEERIVAEHESAVAALQAEVDALKKLVARDTRKAGGQPVVAVSVSPTDLPGIVIDNTQARLIGEWKHSTHTPRWVGDGYIADITDRAAPLTATYQPDLPKPGRYEVRMSYSAGEGRPSNTQVTIFSAIGETEITVDQRQPPPIDGLFLSLGVYNFESVNQGYVLISNEGANGNVIADAVQFIPVENAAAAAAVTVAATAKPAPEEGDAAAEERAADLKKLEAKLKKLKDSGPQRDRVIAVREAEQAGDVRVHVRGSPHTLGETAPRGFLQVIAMNDAPSVPADQSGRLQLAQWLAHPRNPLPARVTANRVWHWAMGAGIVRTTDNFGTTGEAPSHSELLDHLATQLADGGWSIKQLVRHIVMSRTFRLASDAEAGASAAEDPENRLWWRANRRRLEAECIRDAMLAISGQLDLATGGQTYPEDAKSDFSFAYDGTRRSVYVPAFRNSMPDALALFDAADSSVPTGRRDVSTVSPQALFMMNNPLVMLQAEAAAAKLLEQTASSDEAARIAEAHRLVIGRDPSESERAVVAAHLQQCRNDNVDPKQAWAEVFQALFGSIEFRYVR